MNCAVNCDKVKFESQLSSSERQQNVWFGDVVFHVLLNTSSFAHRFSFQHFAKYAACADSPKAFLRVAENLEVT